MSKKSVYGRVIAYIGMILFSMAVISTETIFFHLLLIITNYVQASFIIAIAMFGIALGSLVSFYLLKAPSRMVFLFAGAGFFISLILSYYNIVWIDVWKYPFFLVFPFFFSSIIISTIFSYTHSNSIYFVNLVGSALGVVYAIVMVRLFKSENALIITCFIPLFFAFLLSFQLKSIFAKVVSIVLVLFVTFQWTALLKNNMAMPEKIDAYAFEKIIVPHAVDPNDRKFMKEVYEKTEDGKFYECKGTKYDLVRAKFLLSRIGYKKFIDINNDLQISDGINDLGKTYKFGYKRSVYYSGDALIGRVELLESVRPTKISMSINGIILDQIDGYGGSVWDPRVPHLKDAESFIVGLSADGIVKSVKAIKPKHLSGAEFNPIIVELMTKGNPYSTFAKDPYEDVTVISADGRNYLERTEKRFDHIFLMNIHAEHGPICSLAPEYFHTVEGTKLMLEKLTERGMVCFEEIITTDRSKQFYKKYMNTVVTAMKELGIEDPKKHIYIFGWDFWAKDMQNYKSILIKRYPFTKEELRNLDKFVNSAPIKRYSSKLEFHPEREVNSMIARFINSEEMQLSDYSMPRTIPAKEFMETLLSKADKNQAEILLKHYKMSKRDNVGDSFFYIPWSEYNNDNIHEVGKVAAELGYKSEIDLRPATDDSPFPFNVYKNKKEVKSLFNLVLVFVAVLLFLIIMRIITLFKFKSLVAGFHFSFFGITGFAFMLIEIVLMQQIQQFIGVPAYSLIIVLGGLLLYGGIGSFVSRFFSKWVNVGCVASIPFVLMGYYLISPAIFNYFGQAEWGTRLLVASLILFPIGFLMSLPFPNALNLIKEKYSGEYKTLMFGINSAFGTLGVVTSTLVSVTWGFSRGYSIGIACYVVAFVMFLTLTLSKKMTFAEA